MWVSAIRLVSHRYFRKNSKFIRNTSASALAQINLSCSGSSSDEQFFSAREEVHSEDYLIASDHKQVVEKLNNLRREPKQALLYFSQVKDRGFPHNVETYVAIIKILCAWGWDRKLDALLVEIIQSNEKTLGFDIHELLETLVGRIEVEGGSSSLVRVFDVFIKAYASLGMFYECIDLIFQVGLPDLLPCILSCNFVINRLIECGKVDMALSFFLQLKGLGLIPNVYTYNLVIKGLCRKGCLKEAFHVFQEMRDAGVEPNEFTCITFVQGFFNGMKLSKPEAVLRDIEKALIPNAYCYGALILIYCKMRNLPRAKSLYAEMELVGLNTNCLIESSLVQCLCSMGLASEAVYRFKYFKDSGMLFDKVSYNILMDALCKSGQLEEAVKLFDEMKCRNMVLDLFHYSTLMNGYCLQGKLADALGLFEEMKVRGVKPDMIVYNILAGGYARNGFIDGLPNLLRDMRAQGFKPDSATFNVIIEGLCMGGKVRKARAFFDSVKEDCMDIYSAMVNGYCEAKCTSEAFEFFVKSSKQGIPFKRKSTFKLLSNLCMEGETDKALLLFESLEGSPCIKMCSKVLAALLKAADVKKARLLFAKWIDGGLTADVIMYTIMIHGYCKMDFMMDAYDLFVDMNRRRIVPDVVTYTVLLDGHLKSRLSNACSHSNSARNKEMMMVIQKVEREMKEMDISPDVIFCTALMDKLCKLDDLEDAVNLFTEMRKRGLEPDIVTYTALMAGFLRAKDVNRASTLLNEVRLRGLQLDDIALTVIPRSILRHYGEL
ncbi:hypothetical protein Ancab_023820 [Ancistrocladus abbreviatus]